MMLRQIPFRFLSLSKDSLTFRPGQIISTLNEFGIFLCTQGSVEVMLDETSYPMRPGDIYIYMPSTLVRLVRRSADSEGILFAADIKFALPVVQRVLDVPHLLHLGKHPYITLSQEEYAGLKKELEQLWKMSTEGKYTALGISRQRLLMELMRSKGETFLYEVLNIYFSYQLVQPLAPSKKDIIFQNFILALFLHFRTQRDVSFYAGLQHLTPRYFSTIVKEKSGSNPLQWIVQMVIAESKLLLETSDLSIKEISIQLNFPTQTFFGKYFKQYVGVSPKEYRENLLES